LSTQLTPTQDAAPAEMPPAVKAWNRFLRAHATTSRLLNAQLQKQHGLTINDYEALQVLACAEGRRLKRVELARRLVLTPSGVTRLLEGLESAGLVTRAACPSDLRVTYAQLTDAGEAKLREASCGHEGSIRSLMEEHLSPAEIDQLANVLAKVPGGGDEDD
jgi:DNA-binding MarR family transcriptional regulator